MKKIVLLLLSATLCAQATIAVLDFDVNNVSQGDVRALSDRLREELFKTKKYRVLERALMEEVMKEQGFQQAGCTSNECIVEVGQLTGVQKMVGGSVSKVGSVYSVSCRIIDVETGEISNMSSYDHTGDMGGLLTQGMKAIAIELATGKEEPKSITLGGGSISGTIKFEGRGPRMKPLRIDADPICVANNEVSPRKEWLLLDENNGMKNVLVFVREGLNNEYSPPEEPVGLDQKGCVYSPHVMGIMAGQPLDILNNDGTLHNIHALPKVNKEFNKAQPRSKKKLSIKFEKPEAPFKIKCDVHPWMGAYIGVFDHPYFSVTESNGTFEITGLNPGTYVIEAWHEKLGSQTENVTVGDSAAHQDFTFKKPRKKK